jgi:RNA polymerase sigma factor (sigma-70 family)
MTADSDKDQLQSVINGFLKGNSREFRAIKDRIAAYLGALSIGLDGEREHIAADVLGILTENLRNDRFRGTNLRAFNFYILSTVRNRTFNLLRKERRLDRDPSVASNTPDAARPVDEVLADRDLIRKIVGLLEDRNVRLLQMKFEKDMSDQEIADETGMTKNAVSTAISRCIKKIQRLGIVRDLE